MISRRIQKFTPQSQLLTRGRKHNHCDSITMAMSPEEVDIFLDLMNHALELFHLHDQDHDEQTRRLVRLMRISHRVLPRDNQVFERLTVMLIERNVPFHVAANKIQVLTDEPEVPGGNEPEGEEAPEPELQPEPEPEPNPQEQVPDFPFAPGRIYRSSTVTFGHVRLGVGHGFHAQGGREFYTSESGNTFDMARPPPGDCFNCGERHWRKYCPYARGNETIA